MSMATRLTYGILLLLGSAISVILNLDLASKWCVAPSFVHTITVAKRRLWRDAYCEATHTPCPRLRPRLRLRLG